MTPYNAIDYLAIGHITLDLLKDGSKTIGGTVAYSGLTASILGLQTGIVSTGNFPVIPSELADIQTHINQSETNSIFENISSPTGRTQYLHEKAPQITASMIPHEWLTTPIVHLGPLINEINPRLSLTFPNSLVALTPQGWMRKRDANNKIIKVPWEVDSAILNTVDCVIFSVEDVNNDEDFIDTIIPECKILIVTESSSGARVYWNGNLKYFKALECEEIDPTGAGDIFSTCFLVRYYQTKDVWASANFATKLAAKSVTRRGLTGVPTIDEANLALQELV